MKNVLLALALTAACALAAPSHSYDKLARANSDDKITLTIGVKLQNMCVTILLAS